MQIVVRDLVTNYEIIGTGPKTVLILHGWGRKINEWRPTAQLLATLDYQVILLDLPGFGGTQIPRNPYDVYDYANFVQDFLTKTSIKSCTIIGHSFGGRLGMILADQSPELVDQLVLVDSGGIEEKSFRVKLKIFIYKYFLKHIKRFIPRSIRRRAGSSDYRLAGPLRVSFVKIVNQDLKHHMKSINCPTLVIWGDKDEILPVARAKRFRNLIPNAVLRIAWGGDHSPHISQAKQFHEIITEWFTQS